MLARLRAFFAGVATGCGRRVRRHGTALGGGAGGRGASPPTCAGAGALTAGQRGSSRPKEIMSCRHKSPKKKLAKCDCTTPAAYATRNPEITSSDLVNMPTSSRSDRRSRTLLAFTFCRQDLRMTSTSSAHTMIRTISSDAGNKNMTLTTSTSTGSPCLISCGSVSSIRTRMRDTRPSLAMMGATAGQSFRR